MPFDALTRVAEVLDAGLEEVLLEASPAFRRLRNPVLRATVARFATLEQAARMADLPLPDLLARLARARGEACPGPGTPDPAGPPAPEGSDAGPWPDWARPDEAVLLDAEALLARGRHPLAEARAALRAAGPGGQVLLSAPFEPAPLLAQARAEGLLAAHRVESGRHRVLLALVKP